MEDILDILDNEVDETYFPVLGLDSFLGIDYVGIALHGYRSVDSWLLAFERVGYSRSNGDYRNHVDSFSPNGHDQKRTRYPLSAHGDSYIVNDVCILDPFDFELVVAGVNRRFQFTRDEYRALGVDFESFSEDMNGEIKKATAILRILNSELGDELYLDPLETLKVLELDRGDLQHVLSTRDFYLPPRPTLPSGSKTFQLIAEALIHTDASRYTLAAPETPNTRTSDWPYPGVD